MYYIGDEEIAALSKIFGKSRLYRYHADGPSECDMFENEFSSHLKVAHSILLNSGTNALVAALLAVGIRPGDEILMPTYTFVATAAAIVQVGALPVLVNIDSELGLCAKDASLKITKKTKAILLVHMDGLAANVAEVRSLAEKNSLHFIEDVAQAIGGSWQGQRLGSFGAFGCFSLNENKIISCGEGGILVTKDRALYEKAFCIHDSPAQFNPTKSDFFTQVTPFLGGSMRVSEIQGAIMRVQLTRLEKILNELRARKEIVLTEISDIKGVRILRGHCAAGDCGSSVHLQFADPGHAFAVGKRLRAEGLLFLPVTARPAHVSWKWAHLLGKQAHIQPERNPFLLSEHSYVYSTADCLESVDILSRTLRWEVDLSLTPAEAQSLASKLTSILRST